MTINQRRNYGKELNHAKLAIKIVCYEDFSVNVEEKSNISNISTSSTKQKNFPNSIWRNQGMSIRLEFLKSCKRIALEENKKLYEVIDEALGQYLDRHAESNR